MVSPFRIEGMCPDWCGSVVECGHESKVSRFNSQSTALAWVVIPVPSRECARGNRTLVVLSLTFSLLSLF